MEFPVENRQGADLAGIFPVYRDKVNLALVSE
jgi:hypothetical protein